MNLVPGDTARPVHRGGPPHKHDDAVSRWLGYLGDGFHVLSNAAHKTMMCVLTLTLVVGSYLVLASLGIRLTGGALLGTAVADLAALVIARRLRRDFAARLRIPGRTTATGRFGLPVGRHDTLTVAFGLVLAFAAGQCATVWVYDHIGHGTTGTGDLHPVTGLTAPGVATLVFMLMIAPIGEEAVMRGLLYPALRRYLQPVAATAMTTACFAVLHGNLVQSIAVIPLGVLLAMVYERAQTLTPVIAIHAGFNLLAILVPVAAVTAIASPAGVIILLAGFIAVLTMVNRTDTVTIKPRAKR